MASAKALVTAFTGAAQDAFKQFVGQQGGDVAGAEASFETLLDSLEPELEDLTARAIAGDANAAADLPYIEARVQVVLADQELTFIQAERQQVTAVVSAVVGAAFKAAIGAVAASAV